MEARAASAIYLDKTLPLVPKYGKIICSNHDFELLNLSYVVGRDFYMLYYQLSHRELVLRSTYTDYNIDILLTDVVYIDMPVNDTLHGRLILPNDIDVEIIMGRNGGQYNKKFIFVFECIGIKRYVVGSLLRIEKNHLSPETLPIQLFF